MDMQAATGMPRGTISSILAELQLRGIVQLGINMQDARSRCYYLARACQACDSPILDGTPFHESAGKRWHTTCEVRHG